ncbi:MAG: TauD/TfdA family dioxygenase [Deltaproteobacteria bacterium]|nr:TauD/TfdA family dioxygenase [Deltaproteobacteria bacterium]
MEPNEVEQIQALLASLRNKYSHVEDLGFHREIPVLRGELPVRLRRALFDFERYEPNSALLCIDGYPIDELKVGPTPPDWKGYKDRNSAMEEEMLLALFGSCLGTCIAWSTQQDGRVVHDIAPIKKHQKEQLGSGSDTLLWWHVEDAFHPYRGDYIGMACLRNPDLVPTTFASADLIDLSDEHIDLLFERHYTIRPDESHLVKNKATDRDLDPTLGTAYEGIHRMNDAPDKVAVFFGRRDAPYMRLDPYFMDPLENKKAQEALDALIAQIDEKIKDLVLEPGTFCFLDNFQAVHGRKPFKARFDGTDRWMKRVNIVRDLRKSREVRESPESLVIL